MGNRQQLLGYRAVCIFSTVKHQVWYLFTKLRGVIIQKIKFPVSSAAVSSHIICCVQLVFPCYGSVHIMYGMFYLWSQNKQITGNLLLWLYPSILKLTDIISQYLGHFKVSTNLLTFKRDFEFVLLYVLVFSGTSTCWTQFCFNMSFSWNFLDVKYSC